ncbi:MAG: ZIP family metal transporter [Bacteroidetes bacterium]|nr:ZIP family metal transporter [Bacteroidota bacterium]
MLVLILLFTAALIGGLSAVYLPGKEGLNYKLALVFSGAYLFAITVTHILPDLYSNPSASGLTGLLVLGGFVLQQILEFVSQGVEHGHVHVHKAGKEHHASAAFVVLGALSIHALLEGTMLTSISEDKENATGPMFWGILMHKILEAFALMSVLICELSRRKAIRILFLFALASPIGLWLSSSMYFRGLLTPTVIQGLFAVVCGSFLHISTTIVFESSSGHSFNAKKSLVASAGFATALLADFLF